MSCSQYKHLVLFILRKRLILFAFVSLCYIFVVKIFHMRKTLVLTLLLLIFCISVSKAQDSLAMMHKSKGFPDLSIGVKVSTFGPGVEIGLGFAKKFNVRLGLTYFNFDLSDRIEKTWNVKQQSVITLGSVSLLVDWQFVRWLHLTAGVLYNMATTTFKNLPVFNYSFGNVTITPETLGNVQYKLTAQPFNPYLGLGIGKVVSHKHMVSVSFDIGIAYMGSPKVELKATGMVSPTASKEQLQILQNNVNSYKFYPMLSLQISFTIFKH